MSLPKFSAGHILPWSHTGPHDDQVNGGTFFTLRDAAGAWIGDVRTRPLADLLVATQARLALAGHLADTVAALGLSPHDPKAAQCALCKNMRDALDAFRAHAMAETETCLTA